MSTVKAVKKNGKKEINSIKSIKTQIRAEEKELADEIFEPVENVKQSTKYDVFKFLDANRPLKKHIKKIKKSMLQYKNLTFGVVAKFKGEYYILDGQHRFTTCKELGIPFQFVLVEITDKDDMFRIISALNSTAEKWSITDYLNCWATENKTSYIKLKEIKKKYPLVTLSALLVIFGIKRDEYENGTWTQKSFKDGEKIVKQLSDIIPVMYPNGKLSTQPMRALIWAMKQKVYNHKNMVKSAKANCPNWSKSETDLKIELMQELSYIL